MRAVLPAVLALVLFAAPAFAQNSITLSPGAHNNTQVDTSASAAAAASSSATQQQSNTNVFVPTNIQGQQQHQGQIQGQGQGQGQKQSANNEGINISTDVPAQAPAIFAPNLTSSPEACMGSVSAGGGAGFGGTSFGITFGTTWTNDQCQDRMNARTLGALGQNQAALEYLAAKNPEMKAAMARAGVKLAGLEPTTYTVIKPGTGLPVLAAPPVVEQGGTKVEKRDVAIGPLCGDQKPAKLKGWRYSCAYDR